MLASQGISEAACSFWSTAALGSTNLVERSEWRNNRVASRNVTRTMWVKFTSSKVRTFYRPTLPNRPSQRHTPFGTSRLYSPSLSGAHLRNSIAENILNRKIHQLKFIAQNERTLVVIHIWLPLTPTVNNTIPKTWLEVANPCKTLRKEVVSNSTSIVPWTWRKSIDSSVLKFTILRFWYHLAKWNSANSSD